MSDGMLTAEQVREAIEHHFGRVAVLDDGKPVEWRDDWVCKVAIDYRAITDELNATLGAGTCRVTREHVDIDGERMTDYSCGCLNQSGWGHNYCPNCGAKVVD